MTDKGCLPQPDPGQAITYSPERDPRQPGLLAEIRDQVRRVVILKASRIGDFINATPAIRALKQALPEAQFSLITLPMLFPLAERMPEIDRILAFPGYPGMAEQFFDARKATAFFQQMQAEAFDLAVQFQGSGVYSNPFLLMLGARWSAGFIRDMDPPGRLSAALPWPVQGHEVWRNLALMEFLEASNAPPQNGSSSSWMAAAQNHRGLSAHSVPAFPLFPTDHLEAERWLEGANRPLIGMHAGARDWTRRWPINDYAQATAELQKRHGGTVILIGEARDRAEMQAAVDATGVPFRNLAGSTSIPVTGAVLQRLSVFLTNDTGPAHIAYAVGTPTVTVFGGGDPERNGPLSPENHRVLAHPVPCRPCETGTCPIGLECLHNITVEMVVDAAEAVMRG